MGGPLTSDSRLKTARSLLLVGSNPTPSASTKAPSAHVGAGVQGLPTAWALSGCVRPSLAVYGGLCPIRVQVRISSKSDAREVQASVQPRPAGARPERSQFWGDIATDRTPRPLSEPDPGAYALRSRSAPKAFSALPGRGWCWPRSVTSSEPAWRCRPHTASGRSGYWSGLGAMSAGIAPGLRRPGGSRARCLRRR